MAFSVHEVIRVACVSCTGVDSTTLQTSHNNDFVNAKSHGREKWWGEKWGGEKWWGEKWGERNGGDRVRFTLGKPKNNNNKKKQGRLEFCPALLFECLELTNILIAITCNGGGQKVK